MYVKTTLAQEFADARWVVRAKVMAADDHWSDEDESWTIYHLQVSTAFKGMPPPRIEMFTYRNSGGFYLDKAMNANLGGEYLLFLNPISSEEGLPSAARGIAEVNYACGPIEALGYSQQRGTETPTTPYESASLTVPYSA